MENNSSGQSREQQRERWRQNARNRSQRLSMEQRQHQLSRIRENYHQQISTGNNFASGRFQGTHDNEAGSSTRCMNENANSHYFSSRRFQGTHDNEAGPSTRHVNENANRFRTLIV